MKLDGSSTCSEFTGKRNELIETKLCDEIKVATKYLLQIIIDL